jgi:antirestriction protein
MTVQPRIYVACLAAYNNGQLHGQWIDVEDPDQVNQEIQQMLATSPQSGAEEWAIHDHSDLGFWVGEYTRVDRVCELADFVKNNPPWAAELLDHCGGDVEYARQLADNYTGSCDKFSHWVEEFYRETNPPIPETLDCYVDWEAMARDWQCGGDFIIIECQGETHVFFGS